MHKHACTYIYIRHSHGRACTLIRSLWLTRAEIHFCLLPDSCSERGLEGKPQHSSEENKSRGKAITHITILQRLKTLWLSSFFVIMRRIKTWYANTTILLSFFFFFVLVVIKIVLIFLDSVFTPTGVMISIYQGLTAHIMRWGNQWNQITHKANWFYASVLFSPPDFVYIYQPIYPFDGEREGGTKSDVVFWRSWTNFEGSWREKLVMEWAGKDCDFSIESEGARWISLICLWMGSFHYSC